MENKPTTLRLPDDFDIPENRPLEAILEWADDIKIVILGAIGLGVAALLIDIKPESKDIINLVIVGMFGIAKGVKPIARIKSANRKPPR
jgi:hypothetical protein